MKIPECLRDLQGLLEESVARHKLPGAVMGVLYDDQIYEAASGCINVVTEVKASVDSIFMIGSITKVLTASLVMQLVDEGRVVLDAPVRRYLPEFGVADQEGSEQITVRQLLNHSHGMHNLVTHTTRGEDGIAKYVEECTKYAPLHPPGELFSYSNAGFVVAGRLVEVMRGKTWHGAVKDHLFKPLGMDHTTTLPEQAIRFRAACGHYVHPETDQLALCAEVCWPFGMAPSGTCTHAAARDMIKFAHMHLDGGKASDGAQVLSRASVRAMQETQIKIPPAESPATMGIGWWKPSPHVLSHSGGGHGVRSDLRLVPEERVAVVVLTNGIPGGMVVAKMMAVFLEELAGVVPGGPVSVPIEPPDEPLEIDLGKYAGVYHSAMRTYDIKVRDDKLAVLTTVHMGIPMEQYDLYPINDFVLYTPYAPNYFVPEDPPNHIAAPLTFINIDKKDGAEYVFQALQAARRAS